MFFFFATGRVRLRVFVAIVRWIVCATSEGVFVVITDAYLRRFLRGRRDDHRVALETLEKPPHPRVRPSPAPCQEPRGKRELSSFEIHDCASGRNSDRLPSRGGYKPEPSLALGEFFRRKERMVEYAA